MNLFSKELEDSARRFLATPAGRGNFGTSFRDLILPPLKNRLESFRLLESHEAPREGEVYLGDWEASTAFPLAMLDAGRYSLLSRSAQVMAREFSASLDVGNLHYFVDRATPLEDLPEDWEGALVMNAWTFAQVVRSHPNQITFSTSGGVAHHCWGSKDSRIITSRVFDPGKVLLLPPPSQVGSLRVEVKTKWDMALWEGIPGKAPPSYTVGATLDAWVDWNPGAQPRIFQIPESS